MATTQLTKSVLEAIKERRTYYQLNKEAPISDKKIQELVEQAILHVPSSFNSQSTRLVVLLNKDHEQFWDYVIEILKPLTPEDKFDGTKQKINGFRGAYGTVCCKPFCKPFNSRALRLFDRRRCAPSWSCTGALRDVEGELPHMQI